MVTELTYHLLIQQGIRFAHTIQIKDSDGTPINYTGWTPHASILNHKGGIIVPEFASWSNAATGLIQLSITRPDTKVLDFDTGYYTLILVNDSDKSNVIRFLKGKVYLSKGSAELSTY